MRQGVSPQKTKCTKDNLQLRRLDNSHPHIVHTHGMLRGASGSVYIMQERAVCDLHDAAGACPGRVMGEGEHVKEWMLQVAHGKIAFSKYKSVLKCAQLLGEDCLRKQRHTVRNTRAAAIRAGSFGLV